MNTDEHRWGGREAVSAAGWKFPPEVLSAQEGKRFVLKEETHAILNSAFAVHNELGHGLLEKIYETALTVEFALRGIHFEQQRQFEVLYKARPVGFFRPDLVAFGAVIIDTKVIERITDHERGQMLNYLRITRLGIGMILNFKHPRLEYERMAL